jgi:glycogen operon protein
MAPGLADRLTGSALQFDHSGRPATSSVNLITAHDGFTLQDVVSYNEKHNEANGEDGNDGHGENYSDNMGAEGPTEEDSILSARAQRRRNLMATLFLSQGTPMLLAGDEMGHSQQGNNNAYCQDSAISWINWSRAEPHFHAFTRRLIAFRRDRAILRQKLFLHSHERAIDGKVDLFWTTADGTPISESGWEDPALDCICAEMRTASGSPSYGETETAVFVVYNSGEGREAVLPEPPEGSAWVLEIDTADPDAAPRTLTGTALEVGAHSVVALVLEPLE